MITILLILLVLGPGSCVLGPAVLGASSSQPTQAPWPTTGWTRATPESQQLPADRFEALEKDIRAGAFGYTDRVLVVRRGRLVVDIKVDQDYRAISKGRTSPIGCGFGCADQSWMHEFNYLHPDFHPFFKDREVHSLQSVTKSIAATAIGIALGRKQIGTLDRPFLEFFKDKDLSKVDARLRKSTLRDLLTMRSGIEWHEQDRPLDDTNTTIQLERSKDWIQFTLDQPMDSDPGTKWAYNSGGSHLQAGIIRAATGLHIDMFAREFLFTPLGITDWYWKKSPTGFPDSEGGLYLRAEDLAKIGYLYLHDGVWNGRRILPEGWVKDATTPHAKVNQTWNYGYQWWLTTRNGVDIWAGRGFGGQLLFVIPSKQTVAVVNAWNVFGVKARDISSALLDALTLGQQ
jgi:CubicO group peptidase (beta-lactamase class C family)